MNGEFDPYNSRQEDDDIIEGDLIDTTGQSPEGMFDPKEGDDDDLPSMAEEWHDLDTNTTTPTLSSTGGTSTALTTPSNSSIFPAPFNLGFEDDSTSGTTGTSTSGLSGFNPHMTNTAIMPAGLVSPSANAQPHYRNPNMASITSSWGSRVFNDSLTGNDNVDPNSISFIAMPGGSTASEIARMVQLSRQIIPESIPFYPMYRLVHDLIRTGGRFWFAPLLLAFFFSGEAYKGSSVKNVPPEVVKTAVSTGNDTTPFNGSDSRLLASFGDGIFWARAQLNPALGQTFGMSYGRSVIIQYASSNGLVNGETESQVLTTPSVYTALLNTTYSEINSLAKNPNETDFGPNPFDPNLAKYQISLYLLGVFNNQNLAPTSTYMKDVEQMTHARIQFGNNPANSITNPLYQGEVYKRYIDMSKIYNAPTP